MKPEVPLKPDPLAEFIGAVDRGYLAHNLDEELYGR